MIKLGKDHYAALNPYMSSPITVIDKLSHDILQSFNHGTSSGNCIKHFKQYPSREVSDIITGLLDSELLYTEKNPKVRFKNSRDLNVWLHVTNNCNLRCRYCYVMKSRQKLSKQTASSIIDSIYRSARKHRMESVHLKFAGGEPTLCSDTIEYIISINEECAKSANVDTRYSILTNGTILNDHLLRVIKKHDMHVMISLDGLANFHDKQRKFADGRGSFSVVETNLKKLLDSNVSCNLSITLTGENVAGLPELVKYALSEKIDFVLNMYRENNCSINDKDLTFKKEIFIRYFKEAFRVIEDRLPRTSLLNVLSDRAALERPHNRTCSVGTNYLVFDCKGNVSKCQMDIRKVITTMNSSDPLGEVIKDKQGIQNLTVEEKDECKACIWRYYCTGGCPLMTHRKTGSYNSKSPDCAIYKALIPEIVRLEGLRLLKYGG